MELHFSCVDGIPQMDGGLILCGWGIIIQSQVMDSWMDYATDAGIWISPDTATSSEIIYHLIYSYFDW